jgi:hypothetical protein
MTPVPTWINTELDNWDAFACNNEAAAFFSYHYRRCSPSETDCTKGVCKNERPGTRGMPADGDSSRLGVSAVSLILVKF